VEKAHRHDGVEVVVGEREAAGVAPHILDGGAGTAGLLASLLEHRPRDVEADDVGAAVGHEDGEPAGSAGDLEDVAPLDRTDRVEDRPLLPPVDEPPPAGEPLVLVPLGYLIRLVPLLALHGGAVGSGE